MRIRVTQSPRTSIYHLWVYFEGSWVTQFLKLSSFLRPMVSRFMLLHQCVRDEGVCFYLRVEGDLSSTKPSPKSDWWDLEVGS